jgi:FixJ family two-component response regulator
MAFAIGGLMNKKIARELGLSEITGKMHKRRLMKRWSTVAVPSRTHGRSVCREIAKS